MTSFFGHSVKPLKNNTNFRIYKKENPFQVKLRKGTKTRIDTKLFF